VETRNSVANGREQKSLANQLDRLDQILDGLGEALTEAVAQAVKEGVVAAVTHLACRPDLFRSAEASPSTVEQPTWRDRVRWACNQAAAWVGETTMRIGRSVRRAWDQATAEPQRQQVRTAVGCAMRLLAAAAAGCGAGLRAAMQHWPAATAVVSGLVAGAVAYLIGPAAAGLACGAFALLLVFAAASGSIRPAHWGGLHQKQKAHDARLLLAGGGRA
jgi:hypothetical protein